MKRLVLFATLAVVALSASSCYFNCLVKIDKGNGIPVERAFDVEDFDSIALVTSADIYYSQTPGSWSAVLTCDENLADYYKVNSDSGILSLQVEKGVRVIPKAKTFLTANSSTLRSVAVAGSGDCRLATDVVVNSDFSFQVNGSGDLDARALSCKDFTSDITGSGDVYVKELTAQNAKFSISGSGDVEVDCITADSIVLTITGSGDAELHCKDAGDINVRITGSGDVVLSGSARSLNTKITGSGNVNSRNLSLSSGK